MKELLKTILKNIKEQHISKIDGLKLIEAVKNKKDSAPRYSLELHPLLHQNTSNLSEQKFTSTFSGEEFFLRDHRINGQKVLPGVAYLEMARAAIVNATRTNNHPIQLENIVWVKPFSVDDKSNDINIALFPEENNQASYEIYGNDLSNGEDVVYSQGKIKLVGVLTTGQKLNIESIKKEYNKKTITHEEVYKVLEKTGMSYGISHRSIRKLYIGDNQVLARLELPDNLASTKDQYILHPSIMDGALQASIGLMLTENTITPGFLPVPFALGKIDILEKCTDKMWAIVRYSEDSAADSKIQKLNIIICDNNGKICVKLKDFTSKVLESGVDVKHKTQGNKEVRSDFSIQRESKLDKGEIKLDKNKPGSLLELNILEKKAKDYLKKQISGVLNLPVNKIRENESFEKYGIDSIMVIRLTNKLEESFGTLAKTLFFEYQNLNEIADYFFSNYKKRLISLLGLKEQETIVTSQAEEETENQTRKVSPSLLNRRSRFQQLGFQIKDTCAGPLNIAIVGLSGKYPESRNIDEFWKNLREGKDCIREVPKDRWDWREYYTEDRTKPGGHYSKYGGFIEDVDKFDPLFFNISPSEAERIDPQERLFLEHTWRALEDAGYTRKDLQKGSSEYLPGQVGVYVGLMYGEYQLFGAEASLNGNRIGVSNNFASVANRVSYYLNIHGPSMAIDTMCSSSLTAIHLACLDLKHGRTNVGIAGGVNITIHPSKYLILSEGQFISNKGHCESFGEGGDGYIPGEGVGVIILKRLNDAIKDRDHIYGVIKGTAINHGGKTNGYSVPNPHAQASVVERAIKEANVSPRSISYIEAHGTGTKLGDPIEIAGLSKTFEKTTQQGKQYCFIGSVKSNIGHCEAAAGIAGVTKVLLQMKHQKIVPSLYSKELNSNINFAQTPFVVNQELREWSRPKIKENGQEKEYPRIAGISAFGAGGGNAHIIIEEHKSAPEENQSQITVDDKSPALILISAKSKKQLIEQVEDLSQHIAKNNFKEQDLANIAYTLQLGREPMEERLAIIVTSIEHLSAKLKDYLERKENIEELYEGQVEKNKETMMGFSKDEDYKDLISKWVSKKKVGKLAEFWVKGLALDWNELYEENKKPRRISLPTYSFAKKRYWLDEGKNKNPTRRAERFKTLHPLLHENTSDLSAQRFTSIFSGQEFFLRDHLVNGKKLFPGVGYLEMARAAIEKSIEINNQVIQLESIIWMEPFSINGQSKEINIKLIPDGDDQIAYEIYSNASSKEDEEVVYVRGTGRLVNVPEEETLDIASLKARCNKKSITQADVYRRLEEMGLGYGKSYRAIQEIYTGNDQVVARLALPDNLVYTEEYVLHPSLMDGALQASIGLVLDKKHQSPSLPFALEKLEVLDKCSKRMWAVVDVTKENGQDPSIRKLDINLCNDDGKICVKLRGFTSRVLKRNIGVNKEAQNIGTMLLEPIWRDKDFDIGQLKIAEFEKHVAILCELSEPFQGDPSVTYLELLLKEKDLSKRYMRYSLQVFEEVQKILQSKPQGSILIQFLVENNQESQVFSGISGLLKTAQQENPKLKCQIIRVNKGQDISKILDKNAKQVDDQEIAYDQKNKRQVLTWKKIEGEEAKSPWTDEGVYLITGGLGGLGLIFARELGAKTKGAKIILTGRSKLSSGKQKDIKGLESLGLSVEYKSVDIANKKEVSALIKNIKKKDKKLNGIIHSAGITKDSFIIKKTKAEFVAVLKPKVEGLINLDEATINLEIDFLALFSSISGVVGNLGQADYASANAFMDRYAEYRNTLVRQKQRTGKTVSFDWPLWSEGGMKIGKENEEIMFQHSGLLPLTTDDGIKAMYKGLNSDKSQLMVVSGSLPKLDRVFIASVVNNASRSELKESPEIDGSWLEQKTATYLKEQISEVLKLSENRLREKEPFETYGLDSITGIRLTYKLEKSFGTLSKMLFFEYQNLREITKYFLNNHEETLIDILGLKEGKFNAKEEKVVERIIESQTPLIKKRPRFQHSAILNKNITKVDRSKVDLLLSISQERIWLEHKNKARAFGLLFLVDLKGEINQDFLNKSINDLAVRHESLRMIFSEKDGVPIQSPNEYEKINLPVLKAKNIETAIKNESNYTLKIDKGEVFRAMLYKISDKHHVLLFFLSHIIGDLISCGILYRDLIEIYNSYNQDQKPRLPELNIQFADYAQWQRKYLLHRVMSEQKNYLNNLLKDYSTVNIGKHSRKTPNTGSNRCSCYEFSLNKRLTNMIGKVAKESKCSVQLIMLSAFFILLNKHTKQNNLFIRTMHADRDAPELQNIVGFFARSIILNINFDGLATVNELIQVIKKASDESYLYQQLPLWYVINSSSYNIQEWYSKFNILFNFVPNHIKNETKLIDLDFKLKFPKTKYTDYEISLYIMNNTDKLECSLAYKSDLFDKSFIKELAESYRKILMNFKKDSDLSLINQTN